MNGIIVLLLGIWLIIPFYNFPLHSQVYLLLKFSIIISGHRNMSRNGTMNIHNLLYLFKDYFPEASHEMIALRSFQLTFRIQKRFARNTFTRLPQPLARDRGPWVARMTSCEYYGLTGIFPKVWKSLGRCCEPFKGFTNDSD